MSAGGCGGWGILNECRFCVEKPRKGEGQENKEGKQPFNGARDSSTMGADPCVPSATVHLIHGRWLVPLPAFTAAKPGPKGEGAKERDHGQVLFDRGSVSLRRCERDNTRMHPIVAHMVNGFGSSPIGALARASRASASTSSAEASGARGGSGIESGAASIELPAPTRGRQWQEATVKKKKKKKKKLKNRRNHMHRPKGSVPSA